MNGTQLAITNATLIDGLGGTPVEHATVVIDGSRFSTVGPGKSIPISDGIQVIDASGQWLVPGFVNGNVHLLDAWSLMMGIGGIEYLARYEGRFEAVIEEAAQVALRNGITTVFDTYDAVGPVLAARDRINAGKTQGARIFAAGNIVGMGGPFSANFHLAARKTISPTFANRVDTMFEAGVGHQLSLLPHNEVRARIRDYLGRGVDMLKIAVSDHGMMTFGLDRGYQTFSRRVLDAMFDEARMAGIPVLTHTLNIESLNTAVEMHADVLIHATLTGQQRIDHDLVDEIVRNELWCEVQTVHDDYHHRLETNGNPMAGYGGWTHALNERLLIEAGARILMGTDAGCPSHDVLADLPPSERDNRPWTLGGDHFHWTQGIVEKGMTTMAAIAAATINVARAYGKADVIGSIEPGKIADFVLLDADPLADIRNLRSITAVYKDGVQVDRKALPLEPLVTALSRTFPSGYSATCIDDATHVRSNSRGTVTERRGDAAV